MKYDDEYGEEASLDVNDFPLCDIGYRPLADIFRFDRERNYVKWSIIYENGVSHMSSQAGLAYEQCLTPPGVDAFLSRGRHRSQLVGTYSLMIYMWLAGHDDMRATYIRFGLLYASWLMSRDC